MPRQENTQNEGEGQNNAESNSDQNTQETSVETVASLQQQIADKDRTIQEEVNRRQTIEARLTQPNVNPVLPETEKASGLDLIRNAATNLVDDPEKGATQLNEFITDTVNRVKNETTASITVNNAVENVEKSNPHLQHFMPNIKNKASQLMQAGLTLQEALHSATDEFQTKFTEMTGKVKTDPKKVPADNKPDTSMKGNMTNKAVVTKIIPKQGTVTEEYMSRNINLRNKFSLSK